MVVAFATVFGVHAQETPQFSVMFDFPMFLSGNFGELRSNHFHSGLDIKTQGVIGKPIKCVSDGYICRVKVQTGGYGLALYVMHDNGFMTVYGHLDRFTKVVSERVRGYQYENETFEVDMNFAPNEFRVKQGDVIAYAGNSGYSSGPHLHFEVRDSTGNELYDPMQFYRNRIKDTLPPKVHAFAVYPGKGLGLVKRISKPCYVDMNGKHSTDTIEVWGVVGVGIKALDYMNGTNNKYGVRSIILYVDGEKQFEGCLDNFSYDENRLVNAWVDYERLVKKGDRFLKLFLTDNMPLRALVCEKNRGWFCVDEERCYDVKLCLSDFHGNESVYSCVLRGNACEIPEQLQGTVQLKWASDNVVEIDGMRLEIPAKELFSDESVNVEISGSGKFSSVYSLGEKYIPIWHGAKLAIRVKHGVITDSSKLYIRRVDAKGGTYVGGVFSDGWVCATVKTLGDYEIAADTISPKLQPVREKQWVSNRCVEFRLFDNETAIKNFCGTLNGNFVLFKYCSKTSSLTLDLKGENIRRGKHKLKVVATDVLGNETVFEKDFNY